MKTFLKKRFRDFTHVTQTAIKLLGGTEEGTRKVLNLKTRQSINAWKNKETHPLYDKSVLIYAYTYGHIGLLDVAPGYEEVTQALWSLFWKILRMLKPLTVPVDCIHVSSEPEDPFIPIFSEWSKLSQRHPIIIDTHYHLVVGRAPLRDYQNKGVKEVPVHRIDLKKFYARIKPSEKILASLPLNKRAELIRTWETLLEQYCAKETQG